jgi:tRNA(Ile)-lysidine synthase
MLPRTQLESWIGLEGAAGLSLVRPLMEIEHFQTVAHCRAIGIEPRKDPSNDDLSFFRNRLRHELIPQLKSYNPGIHDVLARTAKIMAADADLVAHLVEGSWEEWVRNAGESVFAIQRKPMLEAPIALQRAAIRKLIRSLRPAQRDIGFEVVEAILGGMRGRNGVRRSIVGGLELIPLTNEIVIREPGARISFPDRPQLQSGRSELLQIPGKWELANGWSIEARQLAAEGRSWSADAEFDRDGLGGELVLRRAADGDRITPVGMLGSVKLSDLFINRKIPQPARQYWPVVADGPNVLWVPRLHRSRLAAVTPESNRIIAFRLRGPAV